MAFRPLGWLGVGAVVVLILAVGLVVGVGSAYTSTSTFCNNCHEMSTRYVSWTRSTHAGVECMDCHSGVGITGYVKAKLGGARQTWEHYFGNVGTIVAHVDDAVCLKCHYFSKDPQFVHDPLFLSDPLFVPTDLHRAHFDDPDSTCTTCHAGMVHGSVSTGGVPIEKQVCDDCHREKKVYVDVKL